jgi:hypothetical protein
MSKARANAQIERMYYEIFEGVAVNMLDIPKIFEAGAMAQAEGRDLRATLVECRAKYGVKS